MLGKIRKMLHNEKGFTLVELMTVLIILGVILAIGVPKYLKIQAKSEWDADKLTIENMAKAAEVYAAQKNTTAAITLRVLIDKGIIDGDTVLNRKSDGKKNTAGTKISATNANPKAENVSFTFDVDSGQVKNLSTIVTSMIGPDPYN